MKQIALIIAILIGFMAPASAQLTSQTLAVTSADSALSANETGYLSATINGNYALLFDITVVRGSGTANGTVRLEGSNDGTNYFTVKAAISPDSSTANSFAMTNTATQHARFSIQQGTYGWKYWRGAVAEGGTTGVVSITGKVYFIKPNP